MNTIPQVFADAFIGLLFGVAFGWMNSRYRTRTNVVVMHVNEPKGKNETIISSDSSSDTSERLENEHVVCY